MNQTQSQQDSEGDEGMEESESSTGDLGHHERDLGHQETGDDAHHSDQRSQFSAHVVLYQPEIPQNTGNIGRTCVAVDAKLWIVRPAAFQLDDTKLKRAGLDYWQHLALGDAANWQDLLDQLAPKRLFFFSRFATRTIWDVTFQRGDTFVFGRETSGLPESILDPSDPNSLRLPTSSHVRSLNLATTVGIVLYEQQRQLIAAQSGPTAN